jgi:hypothetical protein
MSLLDVIRIAEPCTEAWSSMTGDERARHCGKCDKTVFDLSVLTRAEAEALLAGQGAKMCGRYFQCHDGSIVLADCLVRRRRTRLATVGAIAAAAVLTGGAIAARDNPEPAVIEDVALPDKTEATLPIKDTASALDFDAHLERERAIERGVEQLREAMKRGDFKPYGEFLGGALSSDASYDGPGVWPDGTHHLSLGEE